MTNSLALIFRNPILMPSIIAWFSAQLIKVILTFFLSKKLDFKRMVGTGGMPSSHSATVVALAVSTGMRYGWDSAIFAVAFIFATVVMSDAAGLRRAAGRQAAALNRILRTIGESGQSTERNEALAELLGHTPVEVIAGALLGGLVSVIYAYRF